MAGRFQQFSATLTTDSSGDVTGYVGPAGTGAGTDLPFLNGEIISVAYTKVDYTNGVVFLMTTETGGLTVWSETAVNASKTVYPLAAGNGTDGAALIFDAAGEPVPAAHIPLVNERLKIVIASGGNVTSGTFTLTVRT